MVATVVMPVTITRLLVMAVVIHKQVAVVALDEVVADTGEPAAAEDSLVIFYFVSVT